MTPSELDKIEQNFDKLKPSRKSFISRYGKDAEKVMRSVATKQSQPMDKNKIKEMVKMALTKPQQEEINSETYLSSRKQMKEVSNPTDTITMDVPLFLRMLEYAKEDAKTDMDLHDVTEKAITLSAEGRTLTMAHYNDIVGGGELDEKKLTAAEKRKKEEIVKAMKKSFKGNEGAMYAIATEKAKKLAETNKNMLNEDSDENYDIFMDGVLDVLVKDKLITKADLDALNNGEADDLKDALHDEWEGFKNYEEIGQAISRSDLNLAAKAVAKKLGKTGVEEGLPKGYWAPKIPGDKMEESFKQLVGKLKKQGKSEKAATAIAGAVASYKAKGGGKGPTTKQKSRMAEAILSKLKGE